MFAVLYIEPSCSHGHETTSVAPNILMYCKRCINVPLILYIQNPENIKWYFNEEFAVHNNMRSHTVGFMKMRIGGDYVQSIKQKLNTKISNEAKIVGVDDVLYQVIWT